MSTEGPFQQEASQAIAAATAPITATTTATTPQRRTTFTSYAELQQKRLKDQSGTSNDNLKAVIPKRNSLGSGK